MPPTTRTRARLVEFTVRLLVGEEDEDLVVCVVGSASELGAWDVLQAVPMERVARGASESTWRVRVAFAAPATAFDYKYVVKHAQKHALVSWEGLPGNRTLTIAAGTNIARYVAAPLWTTSLCVCVCVCTDDLVLLLCVVLVELCRVRALRTRRHECQCQDHAVLDWAIMAARIKGSKSGNAVGRRKKPIRGGKWTWDRAMLSLASMCGRP